jgi:hypothetical protein
MSKRNLKKIDGWLKGDEHHRTVLKDFTTKRSICQDKRCKFYGKLAEQGVCYSRVPDELSRYFAGQMKAAESMLAFNRKHNYKKLTQRQYIKQLESEVVCHYLNYSNCLDGLVWLRGENAKLRGKLGIFRRKP